MIFANLPTISGTATTFTAFLTTSSAGTTTASSYPISQTMGGTGSTITSKSVWSQTDPDLMYLRRKLFQLSGSIDNWFKPLSDQELVPPTFRTINGFALQKGATYVLPDGAALHVDENGNYGIHDYDAKVVYQSNRIREFNPYINASDLLEAFIKEVGVMDGVKQDEILRLPIEAFIHWIILQAARKDGDSTEGLPTVQAALPAPPPPPPVARCGACGRFIRKSWAAARVNFCSPDHMTLRLATL